MDTIISYIKDNITWLKDVFTLILVATATVVSILAYRRARATVLQPIRNEVIKKQSEILAEILRCFSKEEMSPGKGFDYVGVASVSAFLTLRDYGFVFKDQDKMHAEIDEVSGGWLFCGEGDTIKDVEVIGMFKEDGNKEASEREATRFGKERFENAKNGVIAIDKIYFTKTHKDFVTRLSEYAENPFIPRKIQAILEKLITDVGINLKIHMKNALMKFMKEFCERYFSGESYPKISPIGVYNEFNHTRLNHNVELNSLRIEVRKYLQIDDKW